MAQLSEAEYEAYEKAKVAEQDARGALGQARAEGEAVGEARGRAEGEAAGEARGRTEGQEQTLRTNVRELCEALGIGWSDERQSTVEALSLAALRELLSPAGSRSR